MCILDKGAQRCECTLVVCRRMWAVRCRQYWNFSGHARRVVRARAHENASNVVLEQGKE